MSSLVIGSVITCLLLLSVAAAASDEDSIRTTYNDWVKAVTGGSPDPVLKLYDDKAVLLPTFGLSPFVVIASVRPEEGSSSDKMVARAADVLFDLISLSDPKDRRRLKELLDMDDFSKSRMKGPVQKIEVAKTSKQASVAAASDTAFQVAWHPNLKAQESGKKKRRKISGKRGRKSGDDQLRLFDKD